MPLRRRPPKGLFARLLDSLTDIYALVLDKGHHVTYANVSFLRHFGLEWEDLAGRPCMEVGLWFASADGYEVTLCPDVRSPRYPIHSIMSREVAGKKYLYEVTLYQLPEAGQAAWTVWSIRDVTDRFNLESLVRRLGDLESNLVKASMDGIIANDMMGNVLIFNDGAAKILGYAPEEVIGKIKVTKLYPENIAHTIKQLIYHPDYDGVGSLENYETVVRHKSGALIPIWLSARLLHEEGREIGIVGYFRDLRERKRLEVELLRSERLANLGRMVAHIGHEIKNPLATIGGFARQLERLPEFPEEARRKLQLITQEVQRLEKFLTDLSTFTRGAPPEKTPGDLVALVRAVAELMHDSFQEKGVAFHLDAPAQTPPCSFDAGQIRQVLINIFKNAVEAMDQGGQLRVALTVQEGFLVLKVTDTGRGIPPEQMQSLFTPFFSTKEGGTGLGLTICRSLITQHGGDIRLESEVNRGTTCTIRLPL